MGGHITKTNHYDSRYNTLKFTAVMENLFFSDGASFLKIVIASVISYFAILLVIRIMGKRTLAKMTAFDFVVTITLGSTLSSMLLNKVPIIDGTMAVLIIVLMQYLVVWVSKKSSKMAKVLNSTPTVLFYNGEFIKEAMDKEDISKKEILSEIRSYQLEHLSDVRAVIMEINGSFSVIKKEHGANPTSLDELIKE